MLKGDAHFSPFMGDNKPLSVGLNPLGIRTASEQLFTTLLPGLNVVTPELDTIVSIAGCLKDSMKAGLKRNVLICRGTS